MRLWSGIEREGTQTGVKTLFVESAHVLATDLLKIKDVAIKCNISRIYLGAGKTDVLALCAEWPEILNGFDVIVETSCTSIQHLAQVEKFENVILRNDISLKDYSSVVPKIDNGESVTLYYGAVTNSLATLRDGIYTDSDTIIQI